MASPTSAFPPGYAEEDISARVIAVGVTFIVLEIAIAALRFTARAVCKTKWGLDDYLIIPALVFSLGMCTIAIIEAKVAGIGRHLDVLLVTNPQAVVNWAKCGYAIEQLYCAAVAFPKLSILASYLRIFTTRPYRIITYTVAGIVMATAIAGIITSLASCHPFSSRWDLKLFISNCIDAVRYWKGMSVPNIATDVVMLILPMPVVWRLQVSKNQKLALSGIFLMGSLGIVASIVRLTVTFRVTALSDGTWDSADIATWSLVESGCYLIAACLPVLRPLFVRATRRLAGTARSQTRHSTGSSISMREQKSSPGESQSLYDAPLQPNTTRFIFNANSSSETNHILASGRNSSGTSASGNLHDMQHEYYSRHGIGTAV